MNQIGRVTIVCGVLLTLVGLGGRFLTETTSVTAFIPLFFGVPIVVFGGLAQRGARVRLWVILALFIAVLGGFGSANVIPDLREGAAFSASVLSRGGMLLICGVLSVWQIRWLWANR